MNEFAVRLCKAMGQDVSQITGLTIYADVTGTHIWLRYALTEALNEKLLSADWRPVLESATVIREARALEEDQEEPEGSESEVA